MAKAKSITRLDPQAPTGQNARLIAKTRLEEMYDWDKYVDDPHRIRELHNLRIAAKRLRYTLEIFADALPEACAPFLKELEQMQEELGALHDSDVMMTLLRLSLDNQDDASGYEAILARIAHYQTSGGVDLNPDLVACLLDPTAVPSSEQRRGFELLLRDLQQHSEEQYAAFRQHWDQLQARGFHRELLNVLQVE